MPTGKCQSSAPGAHIGLPCNKTRAGTPVTRHALARQHGQGRFKMFIAPKPGQPAQGGELGRGSHGDGSACPVFHPLDCLIGQLPAVLAHILPQSLVEPPSGWPPLADGAARHPSQGCPGEDGRGQKSQAASPAAPLRQTSWPSLRRLSSPALCPQTCTRPLPQACARRSSAGAPPSLAPHRGGTRRAG